MNGPIGKERSRPAARGFALAAAAVSLAVLPLSAPARADEPRLAHIFQDNMVIQREMPAPVWGWAAPGADVEVAFAGRQQRAKADANGYWRVTLAPLTASAEGRDLHVRIGDATITRRNVLVGEVWLATGQSNMVHAGPDHDTGVYPHYVSPGTAGGKPEIRSARFGWGSSLRPQPDVDPTQHGDKPWAALPEEPPPPTMNIAQYFARVVRDGLDVPVGIVQVAVVGTNQAAWMARETLEQSPGGGNHANFYDQFFATMEERMGKSRGEIKSWADFQRAEDEWRRTKQGQWPGRALGLTTYNYPAALYNTRIHPLAPLAIRGAIWHQGEAGPSGPYDERLVAMVKQWRTLFGRDFHFIWGTLGRGTNDSPPLEPELSSFYRSGTGLRGALDVFGDDKKVALVELYDVGDNVTHFEQKAEAGRRMGLAALTVAYGQDHVYTGPREVDAKIAGGKAVLTFAEVGEGIAYRPSIDGISGVIVRDKQDALRWGEVKALDKTTLEVTHPDGAEIAGVAYGACANPHETIFNSAGLPASPFRVSAGRIPWSPGREVIVRQQVAKEDRAALNLAHVRRDGYVFRLRKRNAPAGAKVTVAAYVSGEWKDYEVEIAGQAVTGAETTEDGRRYVTFEAPVDGAWVIVAAHGKAAAFRKVNRF